jgi:RNA polymerase sigma-70 factor (ECF subfamily)
LERLYDAHAPAVAAYARRRADPSVADDVVAEVFTIAWRRLDQVPDEALPWLLATARRVLANARRSQRRQLALVDRLVAARRAEPPAAWAQQRGPDRPVLEALAALSERDREALLLVAWDGLSTADAATVAGLSVRSFESRLYRARRRLRARLEALDAPVPHDAHPAIGGR